MTIFRELSIPRIYKFAPFLPILIYLGHALYFGAWIVDDAAITFSYARNLSEGNGLIAQIGDPPVEGFSNWLWLCVNAIAMLTGVFDLVITPKVISVSFVIAGMLIIHRSMVPTFGLMPAVLANTLLALQPAIAIWSISGLENGLTTLLVAILVSFAIKEAGRQRIAPISWASLAILLFLNRPDGFLYSLIYPLLTWINRGSLASLVRYSVVLMASIAAYLMFKYWYFGAFLPAPYYMKNGPGIGRLIELILLQPGPVAKAIHLLGSLVIPVFAFWLFILLVAILVWLLTDKSLDLKTRRVISAMSIVVAASWAVYILMPEDWMSEYRYATGFYVSGYPMLAAIIGSVMKRSGYRNPSASAIACLFLVGGSIVAFVPRSVSFRLDPPLPVAEVIATANRFFAYSTELEVDRPSMLFADIGGVLWDGRIRAVDLGGLIDSTVAFTVGEHSELLNINRFHDYIFEEQKPNFIATRAYHSWRANLESDERFRRDYIPIFEYEDQWIVDRYGINRKSGDYIRKDLVKDKAGLLEEISVGARMLSYPGCNVCGE